MKTTCYLCGETDSSDLMHWGRNEIGWYHRDCAEDEHDRLRVTGAPREPHA